MTAAKDFVQNIKDRKTGKACAGCGTLIKEPKGSPAYCPKCEKSKKTEGVSMKTFKNWQEYLDARGKLVEKPDIASVSDYKGPDEKSPPQAGVPKIKGEKAVEPKAGAKTKPYKSATPNVPAKKAENGGLSGEGDQKLVYEPETCVKDGENIPGGKVVKGAWPKTKTEEFIEKTRDMNIHEFAAYTLEQCGCDTGAATEEDGDELPMVTAYSAGKFHPYPPEVIRYIVALAKKNERILEALIHELKRSGGMGGMLKSCSRHPEFYDHMTDMMSDEKDGPQVAKSLARSMDGKHSKFMADQESMYESVAPPFDAPEEEEGEERPHHEPDGDEGIEGGEGEGGEDHHEPDGDELDHGPDDEHGPDHEPDGDEHGEHNPDVAPHDMDQETPETQQEKPPRKLKKKFGHHNLIDALSGFSHMKDYMKSI